MARLTLTEGFTAAEACAAVFVISFLALMVPPIQTLNDRNADLFADRYLLNQSQAMADGERVTFIDEAAGNTAIRFNEKGNVSKAMTLILSDGTAAVIELGGGRLIFPQENNYDR